MIKALVLSLLLTATGVNAGNSWDLAICNKMFPHKLFSDEMAKGTREINKPHYMETLHRMIDNGAIEVPEAFRDIYERVHHKDCETFDAFLAFVFLCTELTYEELQLTEVLNDNPADKKIRNIVLTGSHGPEAFWLNQLNLNLLPGSRVVWLSNELKEEQATIKWIGMRKSIRYPQEQIAAPSGSSLFLGLEFDNPVGQGTGCTGVTGKTLFKTPESRAGAFPVLGVYASNNQLPEDTVNKNKQLAKQDMALWVSSQGRSISSNYSGKTRSDILYEQLSRTGSTTDSDVELLNYVSETGVADTE